MNDSVLEIPVKSIDGRPTTLDQYRGRVLLIVNVASKCGLTPQYKQLESLYQAKRAAGLEILEELSAAAEQALAGASGASHPPPQAGG